MAIPLEAHAADQVYVEQIYSINRSRIGLLDCKIWKKHFYPTKAVQ